MFRWPNLAVSISRFRLPTTLFVGTLLGTIALGLFKVLAGGGHPTPVIAPPAVPLQSTVLSAWLLLQAFSSGCTAMAGVEAVSNGVKAFRDPAVKSAQRTLTAIIAILALLLAGIAYLVRAYRIGATTPGQPGYESILAQLVAAVAGKNVFYYITISSILLVLALSANTALCGFPPPLPRRRPGWLSSTLVWVARAEARLLAGHLRPCGALRLSARPV